MIELCISEEAFNEWQELKRRKQMADVKTTKTSVVMLNDPNPQAIDLGVSPGVLHFKVKNEGVIHDVHMSPEEAVRTGVAMIQGAQQAMMLGAQVMATQKQNGGIIKGG